MTWLDLARVSVNRRGLWFLVGGIAVAACAITNLPWQLEDYDQAKQAFTSLEIVQQGHWLFQHTPNGWVATKPPLVGWISAMVFSFTRSWDLAWRFPSIAATIALACVVGRCALKAYGRSAALLAVAAVTLNLFAPRLATLVRTDMPLALVIFLIGAQIWSKIREGKAWTTRDRFIAFGLLTAAMLIKGPIVYAFLLPGIFGFEIWRRRAGTTTTSAWCGAWPWLVSLLIFGGWVSLGIQTMPDFLEHVVIREFAGRFEGTHRAQPFYFYLPHVLHRFAPWSVLLIVFAFFLRKWRVDESRPRSGADMRWLILWALGGLLVMSLVPSKRVDRIFPVIPPVALLLAAQFQRFEAVSFSRVRAGFCATVAVLIACVFSLGYAVSKAVPALREHRAAFADFARDVRREVNARGLRFDVIGGEDEGLLPYFRKMEFVEPEDALAHWRDRSIDAVILPEESVVEFNRHAGDSNPAGALWSGAAGNHHRRYVFLTRR